MVTPALDMVYGVIDVRGWLMKEEGEMVTINRRVGNYATVCVSLCPEDLPHYLIKRLLSICAGKLGSSDVRLASHVMVILNVSFVKRAGNLASDVLLIKKSPIVLSASCAGEAKASDKG